jgi:hypothetical protein
MAAIETKLNKKTIILIRSNPASLRGYPNVLRTRDNLTYASIFTLLDFSEFHWFD